MKHKVSHPLSAEQAKRAVENAWSEYSQRFAKYHPSLSWQGDDTAQVGFRAKGISLDGKLRLLPGAVEIELDPPFLLKPFAGKAIKVIEGEIRRWISKEQESS